jgi:hypothetical protein
VHATNIDLVGRSALSCFRHVPRTLRALCLGRGLFKRASAHEPFNQAQNRAAKAGRYEEGNQPTVVWGQPGQRLFVSTAQWTSRKYWSAVTSTKWRSRARRRRSPGTHAPGSGRDLRMVIRKCSVGNKVVTSEVPLPCATNVRRTVSRECLPAGAVSPSERSCFP